jgi:soluble P-type ATPase
MCEIAGLSIAILGPEGVAGVLVSTADVLVRNINDALELLLHPQRVRATLRR